MGKVIRMKSPSFFRLHRRALLKAAPLVPAVGSVIGASTLLVISFVRRQTQANALGALGQALRRQFPTDSPPKDLESFRRRLLEQLRANNVRLPTLLDPNAPVSGAPLREAVGRRMVAATLNDLGAAQRAVADGEDPPKAMDGVFVRLFAESAISHFEARITGGVSPSAAHLALRTELALLDASDPPDRPSQLAPGALLRRTRDAIENYRKKDAGGSLEGASKAMKELCDALPR
jgi:hypothetical protein